MHVTVKRGEDSKALELTCSPAQTVGDTKRMVQELDPTLSGLDSLKLNDQKLDENQQLGEFAVNHEQPLMLVAERRTLEVSAGPVKRRKRCSFPTCTSMPLRGVGSCGNCDGQFCSRHRLMEQHKCVGLQGCKQQLHERSAHKLQQQQTISHKV